MSSKTASVHEGYFHRLTGATDAAFARLGLVEKAFQIDGKTFVMRCAGEKMARIMTRALAHLPAGNKDEASLAIDCWDVEGSGVECPHPEGDYRLGGRGEFVGIDCAEMRMAYYTWNKLVNVYFPQHQRAFYCTADAGQVRVEQLGAPAYTIFSWWLALLGLQFTHAAVIGTEQSGLLIVGNGGAGKSTLSFSTLDTSLRYLSDDFCVLTQGEPVCALALYSSGKLTEASLGLLPHLRRHAANADDPAREKAVFFLHEEFPATLVTRLPIRAIVLSHLNHFKTSLELVPRHEALNILVGSTIRELASSGHDDILRMMRLTSKLPVYRLDHGPDTAATHRILLNLCEANS